MVCPQKCARLLGKVSQGGPKQVAPCPRGGFAVVYKHGLRHTELSQATEPRASAVCQAPCCALFASLLIPPHD